jgi:transitional endoplasmic reticulum ATPase
VDLAEVQDVQLKDLQGVDDVVRSLETHVVLPLSDDVLAAELNLRPKRGILLYGPPGTGKTTVGRALAHRLRGKFFLIDGTLVAGTNDFFHRVKHIFEAARENSPAVIFIDDADAIFEDHQDYGLYRYLLTMLDGLESEGGSRVCVMMTAMNLQHLPPALVRSGRLELWLEMKLPDREARRKILQNNLRGLPRELGNCDLESILAASDTFTGADLKRLVEDSKGLYAYDRSSKAIIRESTKYFIDAANTIRQNKRRYLLTDSTVQSEQAPATQLKPRKEYSVYGYSRPGQEEE